MSTEAQTIATLAVEAAQVRQTEIEGKPLLITRRPDGQITVVDLSPYLPRPQRIVESVVLHTPPALIAYAALFSAPTRAVAFADESKRLFQVIFDYHYTDSVKAVPAVVEPSWIGHRASMTLVQTKAWLDWAGKNGHENAMHQLGFANWIETHVQDIAEPPVGPLIDVINNFRMAKNIKFESSVRMQDGNQQLKWIEETSAGGTKNSEAKVPTELTLVLEPFEGAGVFTIKALLRWRAESGTLKFWYDLDRPELVQRAAFEKIEGELAAGLAPHIRALVRGGLAR